MRLLGHGSAMLVVALACEPVPAIPQWEIAFDDELLGLDVVVVQAYVERGGCGSERIYQVALDRRGEPVDPPEGLSPGTYGFGAEGDDVECRTIMAGCVERELPSSERIEVRLAATSPAARCEPTECTAGRCGGTSS